MEDNTASAVHENVVLTQKRKRALDFEGHLYYKTRSYSSKHSNSTTIYWQWERRRDLNCKVNLSTDIYRCITKQQSNSHTRKTNLGRCETLLIRHSLLMDAKRRPEASPAALLNDHISANVAMNFPVNYP